MLTGKRSGCVFTSVMVGAAVWLSVLCSGPAAAGGLIAYEVGTADVGLATAGYNVRAQDASTVLTNPAGMTRLDGAQFLASGQVQLGVEDSTDPNSTTKDLDFDDTWHGALGAQYRLSDPWMLNFGVAYDSGFQESSEDCELTIPPRASEFWQIFALVDPIRPQVGHGAAPVSGR